MPEQLALGETPGSRQVGANRRSGVIGSRRSTTGTRLLRSSTLPGVGQRWRWTVRRKLSAALAIVGLVPLAGVSAHAFVSQRDALRDDALDTVQAVASLQEGRIDAFLESRLELLQQVTSRTQLRRSLATFLDEGDQVVLDTADTILADAAASTPRIDRILVVSADGDVVAGSGDRTLAAPDAVVQQGSAGPRVTDVVAGPGGRPALRLVGPLVLDERFLGVVVVEERLGVLLELVGENAGLGETGETVIARADGDGAIFLTPVRFDPDAALTRRLSPADAEFPMLQALQGTEDVFDDAVDYRGKAVFAATRLIPNVDWGVVVKIDRAEALAPVDRLRDLLLIALAVATAIVAALVWWLGRSLSRPVRDLTAVAHAVRSGDLETRAEVHTSDETADLAEAFNEMTSELLTINRTLEARVEARTAALRDSEQRLRLVLETAADAFVATDEDGRIIDWNDAAEAVFGWKREEVLGRAIDTTLVPERHRERHRQAFERYVETEQSTMMRRRLEMEGLHREGHEIPVEFVIWPMPREDGLQINAFLRDVSERREALAALDARTQALEESEDRFRRAFQNAPVGMAISTASGHYLQVNPALCRLLRRSHGELLELSWRDVTHPDDVTVSQRYAEAAASSHRPYQIEKRYVRPDGESVWALLSVSVLPTLQEGEDRLLAHVVDFTDRREAEEAMRRSNAALEQFAYVASHDLREPLRMVTGFAQLLEDRHGDALPPDAREYLDFITDGVARMHGLLEDLLHLSRVQSTRLEVADTSVTSVVDDVLTDLRVAVEERAAHVEVRELPSVRTDAGLLHRVFLNLLSNAIKFTPTDRTPSIEVRALRLAHGWRIEVTDNGIGVEPHHHDRIFQMFQRLHTREEYEGSGMGLALVRTCVERLGGTVGVTNTAPDGSVFWFTLPDAGPLDTADERDPEGERARSTPAS